MLMGKTNVRHPVRTVDGVESCPLVGGLHSCPLGFLCGAGWAGGGGGEDGGSEDEELHVGKLFI